VFDIPSLDPLSLKGAPPLKGEEECSYIKSPECALNALENLPKKLASPNPTRFFSKHLPSENNILRHLNLYGSKGSNLLILQELLKH
jgi:hypothetical protein